MRAFWVFLLMLAGAAAAQEVVPADLAEIDGRSWTFVAAEVSGTLRDAVTGVPVEGALVRFRKTKGAEPFLTLHTDRNGSFAVRLRFGTYRVDLDAVGYAAIMDKEVYTGLAEVSPPLNLAMSRPVGEDEIRIALSWSGEKEGAVRDVDAYLAIPQAGASKLLYYSEKGNPDFAGASLDRDDTEWEGPETVTIAHIRPGTYVYYANSFSLRDECGALGRSALRVTVTRGRRTLRTFNLEPGRAGEGDGHTYRFFEIRDGVLVDNPGYDDRLMVGGNDKGSECHNSPESIRWGVLEDGGH